MIIVSTSVNLGDPDLGMEYDKPSFKYQHVSFFFQKCTCLRLVTRNNLKGLMLKFHFKIIGFEYICKYFVIQKVWQNI